MLFHRASRFVALTHNLMDALHLQELLPRYARFARRAQRHGGVGVALLQEDVAGAADAVARALGAGGQRFAVARDPEVKGLATVYDARRYKAVDVKAVPLPKLAELAPHEKFYIKNGVPEQKRALAVRLRGRGARPLFTLNLHLDAAGDNDHRALQLAAAVAALPPPPRSVLVAGGDTNCFALDRDRQKLDLKRILRPLWKAGARDAHARNPADTHFFARTTEAGLGHKLARLAGAFGIDAPRRYDVLAATARAVVASGYLHTPESDHDGAWAALKY